MSRKGWRREPARHSLAARGVGTKRRAAPHKSSRMTDKDKQSFYSEGRGMAKEWLAKPRSEKELMDWLERQAIDLEDNAHRKHDPDMDTAMDAEMRWQWAKAAIDEFATKRRIPPKSFTMKIEKRADDEVSLQKYAGISKREFEGELTKKYPINELEASPYEEWDPVARKSHKMMLYYHKKRGSEVKHVGTHMGRAAWIFLWGEKK